jgi:branched-chain amino acid transport system ATP-binding protein
VSAAGPLLVTGLHAGYGRVRVVEDVSLRVDQAEMVALVGRNGSGKTTSLLSIAGLRYGPGGGTVSVGDVDISSATAHAIAGSGLVLVPEGRRVFKEMTVRDNLKMGAYARRRGRRAEIAADLDHVYQVFPALAQYRMKQVGSLSGGQQQMVAVGQALMCRPSFLLLDEPMSGLAPALVDELYDRLRQLVCDGIGLLIVDQSIERALDRSDRFSVMDNGKIALSGTSERGAREAANAIVLGVR